MLKDSKQSKSTKLGHHIEKVLIESIFQDIADRVDTIYNIEVFFDTGAVMIQKLCENKTTTDFLVGIKIKITSKKFITSNAKLDAFQQLKNVK